MRTLFCHWTWQVANARKFLELALARWVGAEEDLKEARAARAFAFEQFREAVRNGDEDEKRTWEQERKEAKAEFEKAKAEFDEAKEEARKAREELEKAKSTAPLQAGGAFALLRVQFVQSTIVGFWGHALLSARIPLVAKLHCVGLQLFGEWPVLRLLCALQVAVVFV